MVCFQCAERRAPFDQQTLTRAERSERRSAQSRLSSSKINFYADAKSIDAEEIKRNRHSHKLVAPRRMPAMCRVGIFIV